MRIAIVGGGIGGLTLALALARQDRHAVTVYEQASAFRAVGAGIQLSPNATHVLGALGLLDDLAPYAVRPRFAVVKRYFDGSEIMRTAIRGAVDARFGAPYLHVHRHDLHRVLIDAVTRERRVRVQLGTRLMMRETQGDHVVLRFSDGRIEGAELLVGADGLHSVVAGRRDVPFAGFVAYRGTVRAKNVPHPLERNATVYWGPQCHFVHYLVRGAREVNWVGVVEQQAAAPESWTQRAPDGAAAEAFAGFAPVVRALIAHTTRPMCWGLYDRPPRPARQGERTVLLGDAAHPMLPFLAQGAAMAIEDAWALSDELNARRDLDAALVGYAKRRQARCADVVHISRRNAALFHLEGVGAMGRNMAFRLISRFAPSLLSRPYDHVYGHNETAVSAK